MTADELERMLPLYEAKMIHHYDHRWATYEADGTPRDVYTDEKRDPDFYVQPRYWVEECEVGSRLSSRWGRDWLLGFRNICRSTDERSVIDGILPTTAVGHSMPLLFAPDAWLLASALSSFVLDYILRQKLGGTNLTYNYFEQLSVPAPDAFDRGTPWDIETSLRNWVSGRVVELSYTATDMRQFATFLKYDGAPFRWDAGRRALLCAELDAAYFHLYGVERDDVEYILDTFPIVKRKDMKAFGEYRTKRLILEVYDAMAEAMVTGSPYQTILDPPPGQGPRHPERTENR